MTLTVITPPAEPAVSLADAKAYLRIGHAGEDALLAELVAAATTRLEAASGLTLVRRTLSRRLYAWPATLAGNGFILRPRPVTRLVSVTVTDETGASEDITSRFQIFAGRLVVRPWSVAPAICPGGHAEIVFECGHGAAADLPDDLQLAVMRLTAEAYRSGRSDLGGDSGLPADVAAIITAHRELRV